jgi:type IV pilus assembly protein PilO
MALKINLNALDWRAQLGLVAVLSAVGVGVFWYLYADPYQTELNGKRAELRKTRAEIERSQKVARRLPEFQKGVGALESQLDALRMQLPEEQDVAELLRRVQAMATESRLTIRGFTPQAVTRKELHAEWPIGLALEGTYHDLGAFLERVSKFPRIINVGNIKIESHENASSGATVVADCTATAFVLVKQADDKDKDKAKDAAAAKGKKKPAKGKAEKADKA